MGLTESGMERSTYTCGTNYTSNGAENKITMEETKETKIWTVWRSSFTGVVTCFSSGQESSKC